MIEHLIAPPPQTSAQTHHHHQEDETPGQPGVIEDATVVDGELVDDTAPYGDDDEAV